jgi:hypothetical protein
MYIKLRPLWFHKSKLLCKQLFHDVEYRSYFSFEAFVDTMNTNEVQFFYSVISSEMSFSTSESYLQ